VLFFQKNLDFFVENKNTAALQKVVLFDFLPPNQNFTKKNAIRVVIPL